MNELTTELAFFGVSFLALAWLGIWQLEQIEKQLKRLADQFDTQELKRPPVRNQGESGTK